MLLNHSPVILVYPFVKVCQVTLLTLKLESVPYLSRCPSYLEQKDGTFWVLNCDCRNDSTDYLAHGLEINFWNRQIVNNCFCIA